LRGGGGVGGGGGRLVEQSTRRDLYLAGWREDRGGWWPGDGSSLGGESRVIRKNYVH